MNWELLAWIILRLVFAWMFLSAIPVLLKNWSATVSNTGLLFPYKPEWFARGSIFVMAAGSCSILFGFYGRIGALGLLIFSLGGAIVHFRLAQKAQDSIVSLSASLEDKNTLEQLKILAVAGHSTSAQKNYVLAAVAAYFLLHGTGPWSLTSA